MLEMNKKKIYQAPTSTPIVLLTESALLGASEVDKIPTNNDYEVTEEADAWSEKSEGEWDE